MDDIKDILSKRSLNQPPEIEIIKSFLKSNFKSECKITINPSTIIITVSSAALAGSLRFRLEELKKLCQSDKRLVIHIGSVDY